MTSLTPRCVRFTPDLVIVGMGSLVLFLHAHAFRFFCDDAFISLRYARNFAATAAPIYNLGERVEGYTSFAWMALTAGLLRTGMQDLAAVRLAGGLSGVLLVAATWWLWRLVEPRHPTAGVFVLGGVVTTAPVAAWTFGGLETPLFAALVVGSVALAARSMQSAAPGRGVWLGVVLAVTTLARPEGAALFAIVTAVLAAFVVRHASSRRMLANAVATYVVLVGAFVAWRWSYYGAPLPNTFYLKVSGDRGEMLRGGIRYLRLASADFGHALTVGGLGCLLVPSRDEARARPARFTAWTTRLFVPFMLVYVAWIGGDFLDLERFLVPLIPLVAVAVGGAVCRALERYEPHVPRWAFAGAMASLTVFPHAIRQSSLGRRARAVAEPTRAAAGVEPLGWTALYARRWSAMGRWIGAHARPDDWMATGAAGAMPYYAGIRNLDRLGLCDAYVARSGDKLSDRPGHQRVAPLSYTLSKDPVFLMIEDQSLDQPETPQPDAYWESKGYVWTVVRLDAPYSSGPTWWHKFLLRKDRAAELRNEDGVQSALTVAQGAILP